MESFEKLKNLIESTQADVDKFNEKKNSAAGTRVRQAMQEVKKIAQDLRLEIQDIKNKV
jgi:hypothetical protein